MLINSSGVCSNCEKNHSLWSTLNLQEYVDLDDLLNITKVSWVPVLSLNVLRLPVFQRVSLVAQYTPQVEQHFNRMNVTLPTVTFLSSDVKNQLQVFASKAATFNFSSTRQQVGPQKSWRLSTLRPVQHCFNTQRLWFIRWKK